MSKTVKRNLFQARNLIIDNNGAQLGLTGVIGTTPGWIPNDGNAPTIESGLSLNSPSSTVFSFKTNTTSMVLQDMPTPIVGHVYYGGCLFRSEAGFTAGDGRFEWWYNDTANGLMVFSTRVTSTNGEWVINSAVHSLSSLASTTGWKIRNFIVNGTTASYSCKHIK